MLFLACQTHSICVIWVANKRMASPYFTQSKRLRIATSQRRLGQSQKSFHPLHSKRCRQHSRQQKAQWKARYRLEVVVRWRLITDSVYYTTLQTFADVRSAQPSTINAQTALILRSAG